MHGTSPAEKVQTQDGTANAESLRPVQAAPQLLVAPPPTDNVWEKRAEERESAERERAARDAQMRLQQQHFSSLAEQTGQFDTVKRFHWWVFSVDRFARKVFLYT